MALFVFTNSKLCSVIFLLMTTLALMGLTDHEIQKGCSVNFTLFKALVDILDPYLSI